MNEAKLDKLYDLLHDLTYEVEGEELDIINEAREVVEYKLYEKDIEYRKKKKIRERKNGKLGTI